MPFENLLLEIEDQVAVVTLNRPEKLNAINHDLHEEMMRVCRQLQEDDGVRVVIWTGAEMLVEGATGLASEYGIPESVVGLSVVALGTSLPELAVTLVAGLRGQGGVAVGNVLGSNVMNILGILGFAATYSGGLIVAPEFAQRDIWVVVLTSGFVVAMLYYEREIGKKLGFGMVLGYLSYMALLYI